MVERVHREGAKVVGSLLLVVDDDECMRSAVADTLTRSGFRVVERACGRSALDYLREGERPELILLDLVMPDMDGWEFRSEQLGDDGLADIPVVALSGDASAKARAVHAEAVLAKPVTSPQLLKTVERVLHDRRLGSRSERAEEHELAHLGEFVEQAIRPMQLANSLAQVNIDSAIELLTEGGSNTARVLWWLSGAKVATNLVNAQLARAELFAHRNHGRLKASRGRVLLVDDDIHSRDLLTEALRELFNVDLALHVSEALQALQTHDDYDAVLCRLSLRSQSGADLLLSLLPTHPEQAKRILFFGADPERDRDAERRLSTHQFLGIQRGPVRIEELCVAVAVALVQPH